MDDYASPTGDALPKAVLWMDEKLRSEPGGGGRLARLIAEAARRFDLSPLEEQFLLDRFLPRPEVHPPSE
ncbi:MAG: hypothetical protein QM765_01000 [Myxococcales bacterium]